LLVIMWITILALRHRHLFTKKRLKNQH